MINNCNCCNKYPKVKELISCENVKCLEFGQEFFVWDWQKKEKVEAVTYEIEGVLIS